MDELKDLQTAMDAVLKLQSDQGYAQNTLKLHKNVFPTAAHLSSWAGMCPGN